MMTDDHDIIGTRPAPRPVDFGLFAPPATGSSLVYQTPGIVVMPGAGQAARADARASVDVTEGQQRCLDALADGGRTRTEIAEATGLAIGSVNARIAELRAANKVVAQGRRDVAQPGGRVARESVCYLREDAP